MMQATVLHSKHQVPECHQVTSFQALCVAFRHPALTSDPKVVCSLLQCCKSWRAALQQCGAGNMIVNIAGAPQLQELANFSSFACWIPKHAGLLAEIHLYSKAEASRDYRVMEQLLALALQSTGAASCLRLKALSANFICSAAVLEAIPAAHLTRLDMDSDLELRDSDTDPNRIAVALRRLTNLRHLSCTVNNIGKNNISDSCLASIGQLCCLTNLDLSFVAADSNLALLPTQLQHLKYNGHCGTTPLLLGHLTALQELSLLVFNGRPAPGSTLPSQVSSLYVWAAGSDCNLTHLNISGLHQLQRLSAHFCLQDAQQLQQLASLPRLQHVELSYLKASLACSAAPAWRHLTPKLQRITISWFQALSVEDSLALLENLTAATSLTSLCILRRALHRDARPGVHLARLQQLQELKLVQTGFPSRADALHLTALTGLTHLQIHAAAAVDDTVAAALAYRLTQLQELQLVKCGLRNPAALPIIAGLSRLRVLDLSGYPGHMSDEDVMLLTSLTGLQQLTADRTFSEAALARFWAAVRGE